MGEVTVNAFRDAINLVLNAAFPGIDITEEEIKQGLQEPCFFVKLLQCKQNQELGDRYRRVYSFDICYFDADNRSMCDAAERLCEVIEQLTVDGLTHRGTGMRHEVIDGVLHFFVDFSFLVRRQEEEVPKMQRMEQEGQLK